jgi:hypothetical protein
MSAVIKDFYTIGYQFARRLEPKRDPAAADEYARHMCVLWLFLSVVLFLELVTSLLRIPLGNLMGNSRVLHILVVVVALIVGNILIKKMVSRIPELQTTGNIERCHNALSARRKIVLVGSAVGTLLAVLVIVAARQFLGAFGGL